MSGERAVAEMMKKIKQLDKDAIPGKRVIAEINQDVLSSSDKEKALDSASLTNKKNTGP